MTFSETSMASSLFARKQRCRVTSKTYMNSIVPLFIDNSTTILMQVLLDAGIPSSCCIPVLPTLADLLAGQDGLAGSPATPQKN